MGKVVKLTPDERQRIIGLLESGMSVGETARQTGRSKGIVSLLGKRAGVDLDRSRGRKLARAAREFDRVERLSLINETAARLREVLSAGGLSPRELQAASVTLGILIDKRRLETGEATSRTETATVHIYVPASPRLSRPASQVMDVAPARLPEGTD